MLAFLFVFSLLAMSIGWEERLRNELYVEWDVKLLFNLVLIFAFPADSPQVSRKLSIRLSLLSARPAVTFPASERHRP